MADSGFAVPERSVGAVGSSAQASKVIVLMTRHAAARCQWVSMTASWHKVVGRPKPQMLPYRG